MHVLPTAYPLHAPSLPSPRPSQDFVAQSPAMEAASPAYKPARTGRLQQRYDDQGCRLLTGTVPLITAGDGSISVVMVKSKRRSDWTLPKGGWEDDESAEEGAAREAYEEAGVLGKVGARLGTFEFSSRSNPGRTNRLTMFLLKVDEVLKEWPEDERDRTMVTLTEAMATAARPEVAAALKAAAAQVEVGLEMG
ncbi:unnamed protein product [Chrysoparadoxa australica]